MAFRLLALKTTQRLSRWEESFYITGHRELSPELSTSYTCSVNPLRANSDQHQISPHHISAL